MFSLNGLRNRTLWMKLRRREFIRKPGETIDGGFRRAVEEAGLTLDAPGNFQLSDESWVESIWTGRYGLDPRVTLVEALDPKHLSRDVDSLNGNGWCAILEGERLRLLRAPEAREFWKEWWRTFRNP